MRAGTASRCARWRPLRRVAGEGAKPSPYSDAVSVGYDPTVTDQDANQVDALAVSRIGTDIVLRWRLRQDNGREASAGVAVDGGVLAASCPAR